MMLEIVLEFFDTFRDTVMDVFPIISLIFIFQVFVLKKNIPNLKRVVLGFIYVIVGLSFFLMGLEKALFPIGEAMATQLASKEFLNVNSHSELTWKSYYWLYLFAATIGFSTTIAEPSLIAVAIKASEASAGTMSKNLLRVVVAIGVAVSIVLGVHRIIIGTPIQYYIMAGYIIVVLLTILAPKNIVPLAYDSGGVTTSTVTVPVVAALGFGLSTIIPGRNPAIDGFGIIALASVMPVISVLCYAIIVDFLYKTKLK